MSIKLTLTALFLVQNFVSEPIKALNKNIILTMRSLGHPFMSNIYVMMFQSLCTSTRSRMKIEYFNLQVKVCEHQTFIKFLLGYFASWNSIISCCVLENVQQIMISFDNGDKFFLRNVTIRVLIQLQEQLLSFVDIGLASNHFIDSKNGSRNMFLSHSMHS